MKALRNQWTRLRSLGQAVYESREQTGRACSSGASASGRTAEYAKLNLPRGDWQGKTGNWQGKAGQVPRTAHRSTFSSHHDWGIFALTGAFGVTGAGMLLLYANRSDYASMIPIQDYSKRWAGFYKDAKCYVADMVRMDSAGPVSNSGNFLADAAAMAAPAVVNVTANLEEGDVSTAWADRTCGSGFITDASGVIVTNAHVVDNAICKQQMTEGKWRERPLRVALQDGRSFEAKVIGMNRQSDVALIQITAPTALPTVKLGRSKSMRVGEWVLALGSPLTLQNSVTAGIVSCTGRKAEELGLVGSSAMFIQTDAAINTGNSGGPLLNMAGEVIGISCMKALNSNGVSFAIPIDSALDIINQMGEEEDHVKRPYVGIQMLELDAETALQMHRKNSKLPILAAGIFISSVSKGSPADKAGLKAGDVITGIDGNLGFLTVSSLMARFSSSIGEKIKLLVRREDEAMRLVITPGQVSLKQV